MSSLKFDGSHTFCWFLPKSAAAFAEEGDTSRVSSGAKVKVI